MAFQKYCKGFQGGPEVFQEISGSFRSFPESFKGVAEHLRGFTGRFERFKSSSSDTIGISGGLEVVWDFNELQRCSWGFQVVSRVF